MRIEGHTPLSRTSISDEQRRVLRSLWVESVEEFLALASAVGDSREILEQSGLAALSTSQSTLHALPPKRLSQLRRARRGGGLGCVVDAQTLDDFRQMGRLRSARAAPSGAFEGTLPAALRLVERMPPVRDQGERGTCVAFASVALREFLEGGESDLSEQFLYWACKELDGHPAAGTYIHTAMTAFAQYGVCPEALWPYNPEQAASEAQGPPPDGARENAQRYRLDSTRTVEPNLVVHYKHMLAGEGGREGMPVTVGTLVFNSWYMSSETHRTGKITLPLPGEEPAGGHAWCIVGYADDPDVPGGGYFIVRNSWGGAWAVDSPEAPGHALMPYAYVEQCTFEAFTGPSRVATAAVREADPQWRDFVRTLDRDARDLDGRLLPKGKKVVYHPLQPGAIREDTPANRGQFLQLDRAWTPEVRRQVWFPHLSSLPREFAHESERFRAVRRAFAAAIDENMVTAEGEPIPEVKALPWWFAVLAWEPKIKKVTEVADLSGQLADRLAEQDNVPREIAMPDEWRRHLTGLCTFKVYALSGMTATVHVIATVAPGLRFQSGRTPRYGPPGQAAIDLISDLYRRWATEHDQRAAFSFFTCGSALPWPTEMTGHAAGDHWLILSTMKEDGTVETHTPPRFADRLSLRNFLDRLKPETRQQRISRVKRLVDDLLDAGYEGNIHLEQIAIETGYRRTVVRDALLALQQSGHYRVYRTPERVIAVGRAASRLGTRVTAATFRRSWLTRLAVLGPAVSVGIWFVKDILLGRPFEFWGFAAMLPLAYGGEWLNMYFRKWND